MKANNIIFALAVLLTAGCQQTPKDEPSGEDISFGIAVSGASESTRAGVSTASTTATRAGAGGDLVTSVGELQAKSFGIFGYKYGDNASNAENVFSTTAPQEVYYTTEKLSKTDANGNAYTVDANTWTYDDRQKWQRSMHYKFRAYWPYTANVNRASTANYLAVQYLQNENYDLMVAYSTRYPLTEGVGRVPMKFKHALAGLRFKFRYKVDASLVNISDAATSLHLKGLIPMGTLIYGKVQDTDTDSTLRWSTSPNNFDSTSELFSWTGSAEFSVGETTSDSFPATVFDGDNVVFAVPQTLSSASNLTTYVYFTTENGKDAVQKVAVPKTVLEAGKIYTFTLVVNGSSVTVNVDIEDWTETQANMDIYF